MSVLWYYILLSLVFRVRCLHCHFTAQFYSRRLVQAATRMTDQVPPPEADSSIADRLSMLFNGG